MTPEARPPRQRHSWIPPFNHSRQLAGVVWRLAGTASAWSRGWKLWFTALAAGALPLTIHWLAGWPGHRWTTACCLLPVFVALLREGRGRTALVFASAVMIIHSVLAVILTLTDQARSFAVLTGSREYLENQLQWIRSGTDPEYDPAHWVPYQCSAVAAVSAFSYTSLGFIPFVQGVGELDLMNGYVGGLILRSRSSAAAIAAGWHFWSVLRGIGYAGLITGMSAWSLRRLTGRLTVASPRLPLIIGCAFLAGDAACKLWSVRRVRDVLYENLQPDEAQRSLPPPSA